LHLGKKKVFIYRQQSSYLHQTQKDPPGVKIEDVDYDVTNVDAPDIKIENVAQSDSTVEDGDLNVEDVDQDVSIVEAGNINVEDVHHADLPAEAGGSGIHHLKVANLASMHNISRGIDHSRHRVGWLTVPESELDQLGHQIMETGGVTFGAVCATGALATFVFQSELDFLVGFFLRCASVMPLLAWFWISGRGEIREATDAIFLTWFKMVFSCCLWPQIVRTWAENIGN